MSFWVRLLASLLIVGSCCLLIYIAGSVLVAAVVALLKRLAGRGETSGVPEEVAEIRTRSKAILAAMASGSDGSHEALPEDKPTDTAFWNLAKTIGIEADR